MKTNNNYSLERSAFPHQKDHTTTFDLMLSVVIALFPALLWSCLRLGFRSLVVTFICVLCTVAFEFVYQLIFYKKTTINDLSAVITGMLIAFNMPVAVPIYIPIIACFLAIVLVKQIFGGIGRNFLNPALFGVVVCSFIWKDQMDPTFVGSKWLVNLENIESSSPLLYLKKGELPTQDFFDLFVGNTTGTIGAISVAMLLIGAIYLLAKKVITWHIPVAYISCCAIMFYIVAEDGLEFAFALSSLCAGSLVLGAFFMATDYTTSPMSVRARLVFGVGCAVLTFVLRTYTDITQDVAISILIMNVLCGPLDALFKPKYLGYVSQKAK